MNLGKLLGAGKSFFGGCATVAYRRNKHVYLPKFNSAKNPFLPKAAEPGAAAPAPKIKAAAVVPAAVAPAEMAAPPAAVSERRTNWTSRLNPFRAPAPVAPPQNAVQTELSLDAVKVVHNDLTDADVDVVLARSHSAAVAPAKLPPARRSWEFLGERLLKAD